MWFLQIDRLPDSWVAMSGFLILQKIFGRAAQVDMVEQCKLAVQWRESDSAESEFTKIREQITGHDHELDGQLVISA